MLDSIIMVVDVVKEPSRTLVLRIRVSPNVESELNLTCIRNVGNRRHRDVAVYPPAVSRGSETGTAPVGAPSGLGALVDIVLGYPPSGAM